MKIQPEYFGARYYILTAEQSAGADGWPARERGNPHLSLSVTRPVNKRIDEGTMGKGNKEKSPKLFRPHPWHGLDIGPSPPEILNVYVEITPYDLIKYEVDKVSGYLRVDRPQRGSSQPPALYGFVPRTYCGDRVKRLSPGSTVGDGDPLDIVVLCERPVTRNEIIVRSRVVGGLKMVDSNEADDKIIAVLENDLVWGHARDVSDLPKVLIERLQHYFMTYKLVPGEAPTADIKRIYGYKHAFKVVNASIEDYKSSFGKYIDVTV